MSDLFSQCSDSSYISELDDVPESVIINYDNGSPLNDNDFLCIHFNVNSIRAEGRLYELYQICNTLKCDCLVLSDTKVDETIPNTILKIDGFHEPIRRDRNLNGGGTMIYIADHLTYKQQSTLQHNLFEHLWVDVTVKGKIYAINAMYRPSTQTSTEDYNTFLTAADEILTNLDHKPESCIFIRYEFW